MPSLFTILLFLHVAGAIIAFGPTFAFPLMQRMAVREPQHRLFIGRVSLAITERISIPVAISMGITGVLMVIVSSYPIRAWLVVAAALYVALLSYSVFVARPLVRRLLDAMSGAPGPAPAAGAAPAGPPPHVLAMVRRAQLNGIGMSIALLVIVALMVWKPGA